ncbi:cytochrome c peroxidase [Cohaesibacter gelatinilyticus]|uniref:Methylamine utilization protein MauG n=2 Tax=Cohaesibacter gelatinilyticus TaxID=372072 RepID=A0A285PDY5_9HYPH|nr:cytochrome c peroxidase [Cohaesibacter gelatinilyticus]
MLFVSRYFLSSLMISLVSLAAEISAAKSDTLDLTELRRLYQGPVSDWPKAKVADGVNPLPLGVLKRLPRPPKGSMGAKRIMLGKRLFEDPILSGSGQIACQSCHNRELGWGDGLRWSFGDKRQMGNRNAPSVITSGYRKHLFWDGRADSLESQAIGPLTNPVEMATDLDEMLARLNAHETYPSLFEAAFGKEGVDLDQVVAALADFQRQLERSSRFERFLKGKHKLLSDQQIHGLHLFRTKARCMNCHSGPLLSDEKFHNLGLTFFGRKLEDRGRYLVTGMDDDLGRFRTPSLRHVSKTAPYMHNGILPTLRGVVNFYNGGGGVERRPKGMAADALFPRRSDLIGKLNLSKSEREALVAFLKVL